MLGKKLNIFWEEMSQNQKKYLKEIESEKRAK